MSWLGTINDNGWRMDILPDLSTQEWKELSSRLDETWSNGLKNYSSDLALDLVSEMFPEHKTQMSYGKITRKPLNGDAENAKEGR